MTPKEARRLRHRAARTSYIERLAQVALVIVAAAVIYQVGAWVAPVMAPVLLSLLIAYFLDPVIDFFEARRVNRTLAILFVATIVLGALGVMGAVVVPVVAAEIGSALRSLPGWIAEQYEALRVFAAERFDVDLEEQLRGAEFVQAVSERSQRALTTIAQSVANSVVSLLNIVLIPVFTFYFLRDFDTLKLRPLALVPSRYHDTVRALGAEMDEVVGAWMRGQVQVALLLAVFYAVGLGVIGVQLGVFIGILAGILNVIPYLGVAIGVALSAIMALVHGEPKQLIGVAIIFVVAQLLDDYVIKPRLVGEKVGMGPMMVMVVLLLGGSLFGFYGLLLSIPAVAAASVVVRRGVEHYRNSEFFTRESDEVELDSEVGSKVGSQVSAPRADVAESQTGEGE